MIQGDLSDRGDVSQCLQCVLCKMRDCAQVRVEQAAWDFQWVLWRSTQSCQDTQPTSSLNYTGQFQFHSVACHTRQYTEKILCLVKLEQKG